MKNSEEHIAIHLSAEMIVGYHEGKLSLKEMHAVESHLLACSFCADAFEGYNIPLVSEAFQDDLKEISEKIEARVSKDKNRFVGLYRIAAAVLLLVVSAVLLLNWNPDALEQQTLSQDTNDNGSEQEIIANRSKAKPLNNNASSNDVASSQASRDSVKLEMVKPDQREPKVKRVETRVEPSIDAPEELIAELVEEEENMSLAMNLALKADSEASMAMAQSTRRVQAKTELKEQASVAKRKVASMSAESNGVEQDSIYTVRGIITSELSGAVLPGVEVVLKGTIRGTTTDIDGKYVVEIPRGKSVLTYSFIGFEDKEFEVDHLHVLGDIELTEDMEMLSEVVVTSQVISREARALGYAISTVDADDVTEDELEADLQQDGPQEEELSNSLGVPVGVERSVGALGQQIDRSQDDITEPVPVGGWGRYKKYLKRNLKYPSAALGNGVEGKVVVTFYVEATGELTFLKVQEGLGSGCDEEAIRLILNGPSWRPGYLGNENIQLRTTVRVKFAIKK